MGERGIGIRESLRYKNIDWLMPSVDVESVLGRLGTERISRKGDEVWALCPDHSLFVGCESSDPSWSVNLETGETNCFTEGRGSNLLYTACRILGCPPREGVKFLAGIEGDVNLSALQMSSVSKRLSRLKSGSDKRKREEVFGLDEVRADMVNPFRPKGMYDYFMKPPGKKPTNIEKATVDRYQVFQRTWGYYKDRAVLPFFLKRSLVGYCALDILGKTKWLMNNPLKVESDYKKVLYPLNFSSAEFLFGYDDCEVGVNDLVLVEGPREVMKLWQLGYTNCVAIMGGRVLDGHVRLISELAPKRVHLMFDGDTKGREFTKLAGQVLGRLIETVPVRTPQGHDPKDLDPTVLEKLLS